MPVTRRVHQPLGHLHGGALAALAENTASLAGNLIAQQSGANCVGVSLNTSHLKSVKEGMVLATAKAVHIGKRTQVWEVEIKNTEGKLINVSIMTLAVIN